MFVTEKNMFSMKVFNEGLRGTLSIRNKRDVPLNYIKLNPQSQTQHPSPSECDYIGMSVNMAEEANYTARSIGPLRGKKYRDFCRLIKSSAPKVRIELGVFSTVPNGLNHCATPQVV